MTQAITDYSCKVKDLTGNRFGRWVALRPSGLNKQGRLMWECRCDCGIERAVSSALLKASKSQSCGCYNREQFRTRTVTHNQSHSHEYRVWIGMKTRCERPTSMRFRDYGGRGITICDRWSSFELFLLDMGRCPGPEYTIDRIDNDGNYGPENCEWATREIQMNKRRNSCYYTYRGETLTLSQWARRLGLHIATLAGRLRSGLSVEDAFGQPVGIRQARSAKITYDGRTLSTWEWAKLLNVAPGTIEHRLRKGWSDEAIITTPVKSRRA